MSTANEVLAERFHMEIFQKGDLEVADEILSPGFVIHAPGYPPEWSQGPAGTKQLASAIISGFPDRHITHDDVLSSGDEVMIRWTMTGTHRGELMGVPATGRPVTVTGFDLFRIEGGKIAELWQNWDQLGLMQQIGALPSSERPADYIDPVEVSPRNYRVLFENERVRVVEMDLKAGETDERHSHPSETVHFLRGGKVRLHLPDGESAEAEFPDGAFMWHEPWTHRVENIGASDILAVIVEAK